MSDIQTNFIRYVIQRFEINDVINPAFYIVGFKIICDLNQSEKYLETKVDYNLCEGKSDNEICEIAFNQLKSQIDSVKNDLIRQKWIIGTEFIPPVR